MKKAISVFMSALLFALMLLPLSATAEIIVEEDALVTEEAIENAYIEMCRCCEQKGVSVSLFV